MTQRRSFLSFAGAAIASALQSPAAWAQDFPAKPMRFIVPLAAGGSADLLARLVSQHLSDQWGQAVVVEMRPGGGTVIGSNVVAQAPADGYTMLFSSNSLVINAKLRSNLPYNGLKAFEPVALMATSPQVLVVNPASPWRTLNDWLQSARSQSGNVSLASLGPATTQHIAVEMLQHRAGVQLVYVPYPGGSQAVTALLGGHVDTVLCNLAEASAYIAAGQLRALAVTSLARQDSIKHVPTVTESGYPGFEASAWFGVSVPAGTPLTVVDRLAQGINVAMSDPSVRRQLQAHELLPQFLGPSAFAAHIEQSYLHYAAIIEAANIKAG
jgi:tripartite-type tricarboxylate transporter receptor subunit TctC